MASDEVLELVHWMQIRRDRVRAVCRAMRRFLAEGRAIFVIDTNQFGRIWTPECYVANGVQQDGWGRVVRRLRPANTQQRW